MKLYIKNMVCNRCIMVVSNILNELNIPFLSLQLGEVNLLSSLSNDEFNVLNAKLNAIGFEIINDKKSRIIEEIKKIIIEIIYSDEEAPKINFSSYISEKLHYEYNYLSNLFSEIEGKSIEKYYIAQKIERVKELLVYDELTLNEISYRLSYSSVAHLSNQFKKVTGLSPSHFKNIKLQKRQPIDKV